MSSSESQPVDCTPSPGEQLAEARQKRGMTVKEIAQALKITERYVRALEDDDFERLPGATFVRGYLRLYAEKVSIDVEPLLAAYTILTEGGAAARAVKAAPPPMEGIEGDARRGGQTKRFPWVRTLLAAGVVAAAGWWWSQDGGVDSLSSINPGSLIETEQQANLESSELSQTQEELELVSEPLTGLEVAADSDAAPSVLTIVEVLDSELEPAHGNVPAANAADSSEPAIDTASVMREASGQSVEIIVPAERSLSEETEIEPAVETPEPSVTEEIVQPGTGLWATFSQDCWLQVTDPEGKILFSGVKAADSVLQLDIEKPFTVRFGNAPGVGSVYYQQQPLSLDLKPGRSVFVLNVK